MGEASTSPGAGPTNPPGLSAAVRGEGGPSSERAPTTPSPSEPVGTDIEIEGDRAYFLSRAEAQLELAQAASAPEAVRAHYHLANLYLDRVYGTSAPE